MNENMFYRANPLIFKIAEQLRNHPTYAEDLLWNYLRQSPKGVKFRRQHPASIYVLDFYAHKIKLAIEIDGSIHSNEEVKKNDLIRQTHLENLNIRFLRFTNEQVEKQMESVIITIENKIDELLPGATSSTGGNFSPLGVGGSPKDLGYYFPAEFAPHVATWLSWPHKEASWPGKIHTIFPFYCRFIKYLAQSEKVNINLNDEAMKKFAIACLQNEGVDLSQVNFFFHPTNDAWCRDHGPAFLINPKAENKKVIVDWDYNAWGGKYLPCDLDDVVPTKIAQHYNIPVYHPGIVMEGGSVEFNGAGTVMTSTACLLNPNRNPHLNQQQIEEFLLNYYGQEQVLWIDEGIEGDDTDGHIDDTVRFVNEDTVITVVEENKNDVNHALLETNLRQLKSMRLLNGKQLNIVELPMPDYAEYDGQRLPCSYANFYICNKYVIVPIFNSSKDDKALQIIAGCFPGRETIGIDSTEIIWGLGSFHCLSQQEPAV
jgi:agmatine deiminase